MLQLCQNLRDKFMILTIDTLVNRKNKWVKIRLEDRLNINKVIYPNGCWGWNGSVAGLRGQIRINDKNYLVPRVVLHIYKGLDLDGNLQANHLCENANCWNPDHLYIGTQQQNIQDIPLNKRRSGITHCPQKHEYTVENTGRTVYGGRYCKQCNIDRRRNKVK